MSAFYDLMSKIKKVGSRITTLKDINENLLKENNEFFDKNNTLRNEINALSVKCFTLEKEKEVYINDNRTISYENIKLKKEIEKHKSIVDKLTLSSNKLELLLTNKRDSDNKSKIRYNSKTINGIFTIKFVFFKTITL